MPSIEVVTGTCASARSRDGHGGLEVLTSMQWFYGPTWGSTLKLCRTDRQENCARTQEIDARQMELVEVLRRNVLHTAVVRVSVLVGEAEPVRNYLSRLPWFQRHGCAVDLVQTGTRPKFSDFMAYISKHLQGRTVAFVNQDVFLGEGWWPRLADSLPPRTAFLLSRYHVRNTYDIQNSLAAGLAEGIFNRTWPTADAPRPLALRMRGHHGLAAKSRTRHAAPRSAAPFPGRRLAPWAGAAASRPNRRTCDMAAPRMGVWSRSLCVANNFGSYDAYVVRLDSPLSAAQIDLFDYPQNAWGGENIFQLLLQEALQLRTRNPCLGLKAMHMHCEFPTTFSGQKVGDRRLGKKELSMQVQTKLRAMGINTDVNPGYLSSLALNVTYECTPTNCPSCRKC